MHSDTCIFLSGVRAIHIFEPRISNRKVKIAQPHPLTTTERYETLQYE